MKQVIFSTLHDPEGRLDLIQEIINQNVPSKLTKDYEKWVVAVSKATYVGKGKELVDKLKKLKGVDVVIEEGGEFCENPSRNNHYLGMRRANELAKELGAGYCFYADADRVLSDQARSGEVFSTLKKSMDRLFSLPEGKDLDLISVIRDIRWETWARQVTEEPLNRLISKIGDVRVDTLGSYEILSVKLIQQLLDTFPSRKEGGLPFPATEWYFEAIKTGLKVASWQPSETMGGYELESDYGRLSSSYILGNTLGKIIRNKDREIDKKRNPLEWELSERQRLMENLISGNKWNLTTELYEDIYSGVNRDKLDWDRRIETARRILDYISLEINEGRLVLDESSLGLYRMLDGYIGLLGEKIGVVEPEDLRVEGNRILSDLDVKWPELKVDGLHTPFDPSDVNMFSCDSYGRLYLTSGREIYVLEKEGFKISRERAEQIDRAGEIVGGVYEGVVGAVNRVQKMVGGDKEKER